MPTSAPVRLLGILAAVLAPLASAAVQAAELPDACAAHVQAALPGAVIGTDDRFGTVRSLTRPGLLRLSAPGTGGAAAAIALVRSLGDAFGDADLLGAQAAIAREWTNPRIALHTIVWEQSIDGIPVQDARFVANCTASGAIISIGNSLVPTALKRAAHAHALGAPTPRVAPADAIAAANGVDAAVERAADRGDPTVRTTYSAAGYQGLQAHLAWAVRDGALTLAWEVAGSDLRDGNRWIVTCDALDRAIISRASQTRFGTDSRRTAAIADVVRPLRAQARAAAPRAATRPIARNMTQPLTLAVFAPLSVFSVSPNDASLITVCGESPTPFMPSWSALPTVPDSTFPNAGVNPDNPGYPSGSYPLLRQIFTQSGPTPESPDGWIEDGTMQTVGNNVVAGSAPNAGGNPTPINGSGALGRDFQPTLNSLTGEDPLNYTAAAVTNLFYWVNFCHDRLYDVGFTEPAGNFQSNNFGKGGAQFDPVEAEAQFDSAGGAVDSYFFSTGADGSYTIMGMFIYNGPGIVGDAPRRDSDFDATLMAQAYGMGTATRLVGGGGTLNLLQPQGLASGWGDFLSLALLAPAGSDPTAAYTLGGYASFQFQGTPNWPNYYSGIRRYPTSSNTTISPLTLSNLNDLTTSNPAIQPDAKKPDGNALPQNQGEIWCNALWGARAAWILAYAGAPPSTPFLDPAYQAAYKTANDGFLALVLAGMQLTPPEPTVTEARDALLQADTVAPHNGADLSLLWNAFAARGLGPNAACGPAQDTSMTQDIVPPGSLVVNGGAFYAGAEPGAVSTAGQSKTYTLTNLSNAPLTWNASTSATWVVANPGGGILAPLASATVTVMPTVVADTLDIGQYDAITSFTDTLNETSNRAVELDLAGVYTAASATYQWLTPQSNNVLGLADDAFTQLTIPFQFPFYSQDFYSVEVGSNGLLTFVTPTKNDTLHSAYNVPMGSPFPVNGLIAPLWMDLNPDSGGSISWGIVGQPPFRVLVITYDRILPNGGAQPLTFQIQLSEGTGLITYAYQDLANAAAPPPAYAGGKPASVGVEDTRGILHTQWQSPGAVAIPNQSAISLTYSVPPGFNAPVFGALNDGGSGQCGIGIGVGALIALVLVRQRQRRRRQA